MKKTLYVLVLGFVSIPALSNHALAQNSAGPFSFYEMKNFYSCIRHIADLSKRFSSLQNTGGEKEVNTKALRDFQTRFQKADNATWYSDDEGIISYFTKNNFVNKVYYDKKGNWQFSLILYGEDQLPADLRAVVKSKFCNLDITLIEEVHGNEGMVYIVHLQDKSNIKILRLSNNAETEVLEEIRRA